MTTLHELPPGCRRVALSADAIRDRIDGLAEEVMARHDGHAVRLVTVLKGGLFFMADLCRRLDLDVTLDFLAVASYTPGAGGVVRLTKDLDDAINGEHVILVEDVVDTGLTVNYVLNFLQTHEPASLEVCTLLDKHARRIAPVPVAYTGFTMSDRFLVGYGLDLAGRYRNLPYIAELEEHVALG